MDLFLLTLLIAITAYTCWSLELWLVRRDISASPAGQSPREHRKGKYSRVETDGNSADDDTNMAIADDNYRDDRSYMSTISEQTGESFESIKSVGSLSTYLAKTSDPKDSQ